MWEKLDRDDTTNMQTTTMLRCTLPRPLEDPHEVFSVNPNSNVIETMQQETRISLRPSNLGMTNINQFRKIVTNADLRVILQRTAKLLDT